jgi:hypothetical protein
VPVRIRPGVRNARAARRPCSRPVSGRGEFDSRRGLHAGEALKVVRLLRTQEVARSIRVTGSHGLGAGAQGCLASSPRGVRLPDGPLGSTDHAIDRPAAAGPLKHGRRVKGEIRPLRGSSVDRAPLPVLPVRPAGQIWQSRRTQTAEFSGFDSPAGYATRCRRSSVARASGCQPDGRGFESPRRRAWRGARAAMGRLAKPLPG